MHLRLIWFQAAAAFIVDQPGKISLAAETILVANQFDRTRQLGDDQPITKIDLFHFKGNGARIADRLIEEKASVDQERI